MTQKQKELKAAIEARGDFLRARWSGDRLYVECTRRNLDAAGNVKSKTRKTIFLTFDDPAECYGAAAHGHFHPADRIAFYEALRIGNPESLQKFIAACAAAEVWDGAPRPGAIRTPTQAG